VVGPTTITAIDPKPLWGDAVGATIHQGAVRENNYPGKTARNGSTRNPLGNGKAGYDSRIPSERYDSSQFAHLPINMAPGDSLVSTISRPNELIKHFSGDHVDPLSNASVLACLEKPVPTDAFRPSYVDTKNSPVYLARNLRRDLLRKLPRPKMSNPKLDPPATLEDYARGVQRVWLDQAEMGFAAPTENMPHYGQIMAQQLGEATLLLNTDYSAEEKEPLLVGIVQIGIDFYGLARGGMTWPAHGGIYSGRKWPILFAGLMLDDEGMKSPKTGRPKLRFQEDDQTEFGPVTVQGKAYERSFSGSRVIFMGHSPYRIGVLENHWEKGWGVIDVVPPSEWPKRPDGGDVLASFGYRRANTSPGWVGQALAARMMHAEPLWNHDAFFAYVDRWMTEDDSKQNEAMKEASWRDYTKVKLGRMGRQGYISGPGAAWVGKMWETYRNNLPPAPDGHKDPKAEDTWK